MRFSVLQALMVLLLLAGCVAHHQAAPDSAPTVHAGYPYSRPLTSLGAKYGGLPPAVQNTVLAEAGTLEITDITKDSTAERVYYKISFLDPANNPPLFVGADGSVLNPDLSVALQAPIETLGGLSAGPATTVRLEELPPGATKVLKEQAPEGEVASIHKEIWGSHVVYILSFKEETHRPKLYIVADGTVLHPVAR